MRVAPIGIVNSPNLESAAEECYMSCLPTHGVNIAIAGASAICCGVAAALVAESLDEVIDATVFGARHGERLGIEWAGTLVSARIELALRIVRESRDAVEAEDQLYTTCGVGMDPTELVPTAIGLFALHEGDPQRTVPAAANKEATQILLHRWRGPCQALTAALGRSRKNGCVLSKKSTT